ncbi:MAG: sulfur carrier protein ThiS [Taibaiella sp.]|nr:sulfur carrier protein ThiS [Taibaiella sp.]
MNIYVNNKAIELSEESVVADALLSLNISSQKGMALAVNSQVIPKQQWATYSLNKGDKIMIIRATQGG